MYIYVYTQDLQFVMIPTALDYEGCRLVITIGESNIKTHAHEGQWRVVPRIVGSSVYVVTWNIEFKILLYTVL
jgi:hypothetical protein